jgi:hypothetical protein
MCTLLSGRGTVTFCVSASDESSRTTRRVAWGTVPAPVRDEGRAQRVATIPPDRGRSGQAVVAHALLETSLPGDGQPAVAESWTGNCAGLEGCFRG